MRSKFSLSDNDLKLLILEAQEKGIYLFATSTCNRTEIYGYCLYATDLIQLLCKYSAGNEIEFMTNSYILQGDDAVKHLFRLGVGLESQILGDFEIIGQIKRSFNFAKELGATNDYLERITNDVIRTSKAVKNNTHFSTKAASVAYAAVQWIKENFANKENINITLLGTGEIGKVTCANLVKYFPIDCITLVNRTIEKAEQISTKFHVKFESYENLNSVLDQTDVLIVATNAEKPTITDKEIGDKVISIIDLSIPRNVETSKSNANVITLDDLTVVVDKALESRKAEIPKVEAIIEERISDFDEWVQSRSHKDVVIAFKRRLIEIQTEELNYHSKKIDGLNVEHVQIVSERIIQKVTKQFVTHLKNTESNSYESVKIINEIFKLEI